MTLGFQNITHSYGENTVLKALNLEARIGDITCLFGPSGSGKSTLLRLAAGLETLQEGKISLNGETLVEPGRQPPPEQRPIGLMFQENALFPHMSIAENIAFGLHKHSASEKKELVKRWLYTINLPDVGARYPHTLSGGQAQRIALARSLAPGPKVLLMDEPYASIDNVLRGYLRDTTRRLLKERRTTAVFVTHDPVEAMAMADNIAVLDAGHIVQFAEPQTLYEKPATSKIAQLFGEAQLISASSRDAGFETAYGFIRAQRPESQNTGETCHLAIRPHGLNVIPAQEASLQVADLRFAGHHWLLYLLPKNAAPGLPPLVAAVHNPEGFNTGTTVQLAAADKDFFCFPENQ